MLLEDDTPLLKSESFIHYLGSDEYTVDVQKVPGPSVGPGGRFELEALVTRPMEFSALMPEEHEEGTPIKVPGPHGIIEVEAPAGTPPGTKLTWRLAPKPEFQVRVPPGAGPGSQAKFKRADGVEIAVTVPQGLSSGDVFDVSAPSLMVRVPDGALGGDNVVFRRPLSRNKDGAEVTEWCRARVPDGLVPGKYFAARLPSPV